MRLQHSDLHRILYDAAIRAGAEVEFNADVRLASPPAQGTSDGRPSVEFRDGTVHRHRLPRGPGSVGLLHGVVQGGSVGRDHVQLTEGSRDHMRMGQGVGGRYPGVVPVAVAVPDLVGQAEDRRHAAEARLVDDVFLAVEGRGGGPGV